MRIGAYNPFPMLIIANAIRRASTAALALTLCIIASIPRTNATSATTPPSIISIAFMYGRLF